MTLFPAGCTESMVVFGGDAGADVYVVRDRTGQDAEKLGKTPLTLPVSKVSGKVIKVVQPGHAPQYWVFPEKIAGQRTELKAPHLELAKAIEDGKKAAEPPPEKKEAGAKPEKECPAVPKPLDDGQMNMAARLLLKSYQALVANDYTVARELADKALQVDPRIAAPHIVMGLSLLQEDRREDARAAFQKASAIDPSDKDLMALLELAGDRPAQPPK